MARSAAWLTAILVLTVAPRVAAVELQPVITGLASPVYVTHARDGSGRLFVLEQAGVIRVLAPGGGAPGVFLDIRDRVLSGGERGLLGLAFHPRYAANGRFFVNYTRQPDGATVVAEYARGAGPDQALRTETVLLTIAQPFANHNGGMVEFGPDGFLYIAVGDGGSANDPGNRAQNPQELLGKILRIDVDRADAGLAYGIPPDNPFAGAVPGRDENYALGFRNPFRFSFDRATGALLAGDVGQGAREEISSVVRGGNHGWRVFEGSLCTGLDPGRCAEPGFLPPIAEYAHTGGRCAVIGGHVYRGTRGTLPAGTYVFGDLCTGEIFTLTGAVTTVLLETSLALSSFGEDEAGELHVVDLGGAVHRLVAPETRASVATAVLPSSRSVPVGTPATAFATVVNASAVAATGCALSMSLPPGASFTYQATDPATNLPSGPPDTPVDIAPGSRRTFVLAVTPATPVPATDLHLDVRCDNADAPPVLPGVTTLTLVADPGPVPDAIALVAVAATDGIVSLPSPAGTGVFAVATVNVGSSGVLTVAAEPGPGLPVTAAVCRTDTAGQCLAPPAAAVTLDVPAGATPTFAVFVTATAPVPNDPARHRVTVRLRDPAGIVRGATSAAIATR